MSLPHEAIKNVINAITIPIKAFQKLIEVNMLCVL